VPRGRASKSGQLGRGIFLTGRVVSFGGEQRRGRGKSGARRSLRREGRAGEREGDKERGFTEVLKKRRGTNAPLYLAELRAGRWASSDATLDAAGDEEGHGAATLHPVIHRHIFNRKLFQGLGQNRPSLNILAVMELSESRLAPPYPLTW
jgi:hypothetical protein